MESPPKRKGNFHRAEHSGHCCRGRRNTSHSIQKQLESLPILKPIEAESQDEKFLSNIIRLIEDHLSDADLNVNALCELSGISNKQIYRKIKQLTGMSPVEYIKSIRMKKAAMLLQQKKFTVAEVMYMVGFPIILISPNAFRQSLEKHRANT